MIDLVNLATQRALSLQHPQSDWVEAVRQPVFSEFCSMISDGEIYHFIESTSSAQNLVVCAGVFVEAYKNSVDESYSQFLELTDGKKERLPQLLELLAQVQRERGGTFQDKILYIKTNFNSVEAGQ